MNSKTRHYMIPAKLAFVFNIATLLLFILSPWNYQVTNYASVILVVVSCNLAMYLGYLFTVLRHQTPLKDEKYRFQMDQNDSIRIKQLLHWSIIAAIFAIPDLLYNSRMWNLSPAQLLERIRIAFTNSSLNYSYSLNYTDSGTILERFVVLVDVFVYFFKFSVLPLTIYYWKKVGKTQKILCAYVTFVDATKWLLKGMNKGIFDIAFVFLAASFLAVSSNGMFDKISATVKRKIRARRKYLLLLGIILLAGAVVLFVMNGRARTGGRVYSSYYSQSMRLSADRDNFLLRFVPPRLHSAALDIDMYLTNGYQGLSYALRLPFKWCFGIGNNQFLISNFRDAFGLDVSNLSYLHRIEEVFPWQEWHNWHTLYTWLANDVPFLLLPLVFLFYGFLFASSWIDSIEKHNPYAIMIFCFFVIRIVYLSANNQVLSLSQSFIAWYIALFMWFISRNGRRVKITVG